MELYFKVIEENKSSYLVLYSSLIMKRAMIYN